MLLEQRRFIPVSRETVRELCAIIGLDTLSGIEHLFIRPGDVLGVGRLDSHHTLFAQEMVKFENGAGVASLHKLYPEDDQTGIGIASAHIHDKFDFFRGMLIGMVVGSS